MATAPRNGLEDALDRTRCQAVHAVRLLPEGEDLCLRVAGGGGGCGAGGVRDGRVRVWGGGLRVTPGGGPRRGCLANRHRINQSMNLILHLSNNPTQPARALIRSINI